LPTSFAPTNQAAKILSAPSSINSQQGTFLGAQQVYTSHTVVTTTQVLGAQNLLGMGNIGSERPMPLDQLCSPGRIVEPGAVGKSLPKSAIADKPDDALERRFNELWPSYEQKMKYGGAESSSAAAINAFKHNFHVLATGQNTMLPESSLDPVPALPALEDMNITPNPKLLKQTVILKLNGGLGTGMGLDKAKSLLTVADGNSFLDFIAKQISYMKLAYDMPDLKFMLMNSFATHKDTLDALSKYRDLDTGDRLAFVQNKAPKVTRDDLTPANWPENSDHEWCPPGHGDLYPAMLGSGTLSKLLSEGYKYMFVSNSDNLGATMDLSILTHFANTGAPFMMEVAARTDADKKGGHLAVLKETGGLTLRESAQCPEEDEKAFQDTSKYKYFNTNNLWVDLVQLQAAFEKHGGLLPLPVMKNDKTVDPRNKKSTKVVQLETAMGAAISCFEGATALLIPRSRFAPVKKCDDLLALRSDAYVISKDFRIELDSRRDGVPPNIKLDDRYKFADALETLIPNGAPSLIGCSSLEIEGPMEFEAGVIIQGKVKFVNWGEKKVVRRGIYTNCCVGERSF
jgi:UDP-N-acetylglucosamine pyrophosphorylase